jgi:hypothetical protein
MESILCQLLHDRCAVVLKQLFVLFMIQAIGLPLAYLLPPRPSIAAPQEVSQPQSVAESSAAVSPSTEQQQAIQRRLTGTWKLTAPQDATAQEAEAVWMIFRPIGQESTMVVYVAGKLQAQQKFKYQVASLHNVGSAQFIKLKTNVDKNESILLLEFHSDRQFRFELFPEAANPLKFTGSTIVGTKASNDTKLPPPNSGKKVARKEDEKKALQKLDGILRYQLTYRFNNPSYGTSLQQLKLENINDSSYQYKVVNVVANRAMVTAIPMVKGLRQYIGASYTYPDGKAYENIICESDKYRNVALDNQAVEFPTDAATGRLQCPKNYHLTQW